MNYGEMTTAELQETYKTVMAELNRREQLRLAKQANEIKLFITGQPYFTTHNNYGDEKSAVAVMVKRAAEGASKDDALSRLRGDVEGLFRNAVERFMTRAAQTLDSRFPARATVMGEL